MLAVLSDDPTSTCRKYEGGLVQYGSYIFLDVVWFAEVLKPLLSHKQVSLGDYDLGGSAVTNLRALNRLEDSNIFEPELARELWGKDLAEEVLKALKSAGLTVPLPEDSKGGLMVPLRMSTERPSDYNTRLEQARQLDGRDLKLSVLCPFALGVPPGFIERLLARCCHLGYPYPVWRYGAFVVGNDDDEGSFSLGLEYTGHTNTLTIEVYGRCGEVGAWATLSTVLSLMIKMLSEFPGLPCEPTFYCPQHTDKGMLIHRADVCCSWLRVLFGIFLSTPNRQGSISNMCDDSRILGSLLHVSPTFVWSCWLSLMDRCCFWVVSAKWKTSTSIRETWYEQSTTMGTPRLLLFGQARPGSSLTDGSVFCPLCPRRQAGGEDLLAVALQVVAFSDTEFFVEQLRQQFAEKVALQGDAPWPGSNSHTFEVGALLPRAIAAICRLCTVYKCRKSHEQPDHGIARAGMYDCSRLRESCLSIFCWAPLPTNAVCKIAAGPARTQTESLSGGNPPNNEVRSKL